MGLILEELTVELTDEQLLNMLGHAAKNLSNNIKLMERVTEVIRERRNAKIVAGAPSSGCPASER